MHRLLPGNLMTRVFDLFGHVKPQYLSLTPPEAPFGLRLPDFEGKYNWLLLVSKT